ncbi:hypothetical protein NM688_g2137 [Phlebia brevispora]|uniref:Uncharacterized protein n=1 Tax=Phlebia brevispora TaxID=194682 RepID=A0ACC1T9T4_9APHY|nr:hypothetical protein NM688_g2137 [Phlebia brevispora]
MQHSSSLLAVASLALSLAFPARSALINVTVDDNSPDPTTGLSITYAPSGEWSFGPDCSSCTAKPDPTKALDGTWHDVSFFPSVDANVTQTATLVFNGSAIYAYCIISPSSGTLNGNVDMLFYIDGQTVGSFTRDTTGQTTFEYNVSVYANTSIPPGLHTFTLQNGRTDGETSLALLDYMVYSTGDDVIQTVGNKTSSSSSGLPSSSTSPLSSSSSSSPSTSSSAPSTTAVSFQASSSSHRRTTIIAAVCSILGTIVLLVAALLIYRRKRSQRPDVDGNIHPYGLPTDRDAGGGPAGSLWVDRSWTQETPVISLDSPRPPMLRLLSQHKSGSLSSTPSPYVTSTSAGVITEVSDRNTEGDAGRSTPQTVLSTQAHAAQRGQRSSVQTVSRAESPPPPYDTRLPRRS